MFTIYGGKTEFSQWEQGQRVTNPKLAVGDKVRFWNASGETHPMIAYMHEGVVVADVPNDLLQHCSPILVELCGDPECLTRFIVNAQGKPAGYKFIDNTFCEPAAPSSGGGVSCWNDIPDKPFVKVGGDTLTWDGNTEGLVSVDLSGDGTQLFVRVSDAVPSSDALSNGAKAIMDGVEMAVSATNMSDTIYLADANYAGYAAIALVDNASGLGVALPKAGVYFIYVQADGFTSNTSSLTIPGYTGFAKEQIDTKVLPEALQFGKTTVQGDTLEWDGNTEGLVSVAEYGLYKISDATPTFTDLNKGGVLHFEGEDMPMAWNEGELAKEDVVTPQGVVMMLALYIVPAEMAGVTDETLEMTFPEAGIYTAPVATQLHLNGYSGFTKTEIKPIEPEYLPKPEWGNIANKPFVVANLSFETMKLDITPDEILAINEAGGIVLLGLTMTPIMVSADEGGATDAAATQVSYGGEGNLVAVTYLFSADGTFTDAEQTRLTGTVLG